MTSSASPVRQRYTADSCTLDVTLHLSALSQWQPQIIAQQLQFQLWLRPAGCDQTCDQTAATLMAEGDRQALQLLTHYIQQQTRATLALANFKADIARPALPLPPGCQLASPLSYLQLCDLTTVLNQCEQAVRPLPVSLSPALTISPAERTAEHNDRNSGHLILLAAVRRRPKLWASSAAAAVFAVGLTTTLWPYVSQNANTSTSEIASEPDYSVAAPRSDQPLSEQSPSNQIPSNQSPEASAPSVQEAPAASATPESRNPLPVPDRSGSSSDSSLESSSAGDRVPTGSSPKPSGPLPNQPAETESSEPAASAPADIPAGISEDAPTAAQRVEPSAPSPGSSRSSIATAEEPSVASAPTPISPAATDEAETIAQIQAYFEARWQPDSFNSQTPLAYQMRLSESGEVVTFAALSEAAQAYRDRLLPPNDQPLTFSMSPSSATSSRSPAQLANTGLTLRLILTADGQVKISKF